MGDKNVNGPMKGKNTAAQFKKWLIKEKYKILGQEFKGSIYSGGWPDFIVRNSKDEIEFFEVKSGKHRLDHHQGEILKILSKIGKVRVMRLDEKTKKFNDTTKKDLK